MIDSKVRPMGDVGQNKPEIKKFGRTSKWVAGGALVLAGLSGSGVLFGWRNARADQARADKAKQVLTARTNSLETNQTTFNGYMAGLGLACRNTVELYLHDGVNAEFSRGEAQTLVSESGNCGSDQRIVSTARDLDYAVEQGIAERAKAQRDFVGKLYDAQHDYELWQGAVTEIGAIAACTLVGWATVTAVRGAWG